MGDGSRSEPPAKALVWGGGLRCGGCRDGPSGHGNGWCAACV